MLGNTNAVVSYGGGGTTINAVNKTGAIINAGDQLWINQDTSCTILKF